MMATVVQHRIHSAWRGGPPRCRGGRGGGGGGVHLTLAKPYADVRRSLAALQL
jgi:hypothetical protein